MQCFNESPLPPFAFDIIYSLYSKLELHFCFLVVLDLGDVLYYLTCIPWDCHSNPLFFAITPSISCNMYLKSDRVITAFVLWLCLVSCFHNTLSALCFMFRFLTLQAYSSRPRPDSICLPLQSLIPHAQSPLSSPLIHPYLSW